MGYSGVGRARRYRNDPEFHAKMISLRQTARDKAKKKKYDKLRYRKFVAGKKAFEER